MNVGALQVAHLFVPVVRVLLRVQTDTDQAVTQHRKRNPNPLAGRQLEACAAATTAHSALVYDKA